MVVLLRCLKGPLQFEMEQNEATGMVKKEDEILDSMLARLTKA